MISPSGSEMASYIFFFLLLFCPILAAQAQNSTTPLFSGIELKALLSLRSSLGLRARDWPLKQDPCSSWIGIRCQGGRVVALNISGFRRTRLGRLSPRFSVEGIQNLSALAVFNASRFALPGSIPEWFGSLLPRSLSVIDLRGCGISSSIPFSIGNASGIRELYLGGNLLTGSLPTSLNGLYNLAILDLSGNSLGRSLPATISSLSNLSSLDLSSNMVSGPIPPGIGSLPRLKILKLSFNKLTGSIPAEFGNLSSLTTLELGFNLLSGSVPGDLRKLQSLLELDLSNNSLSGPLPENLFPGLRLRSLKLSHNNFSGEPPNSLWESTDLQFLDLSFNNFSSILPLFIPNSNAISGVLNISQNSFYGFLSVGNRSIFERFNIVDLSGNYFQGQAPPDSSLNNSFDLNCFNNTPNQRSFEACSEFYALRGLTFRPTSTPNATNPSRVSGSRKNLKYILGGVFGGIGFLILLTLVIFCCKKKFVGAAATGKKREESTPATTGEASAPAVSVNISAIGDSFTLDQILLATGNFDASNLMKRGHSGDIYRGVLESGSPVAVKRVVPQENKKESYINELEFFAKYSSSRMVPFLGHSLKDTNQKLLIYKYMPNRDLSSSLFRKSGQEGEGLQSLDWITRLKIAIGVAEALCYLHHECSPPLVHRDIQASSILLDDKFEVRLGSLSEVCPQEGEPHQRGITRFLRKASDHGTSGAASATCSYDVYCLGKVLLELVTGKLGISGSNDAATNEYLEKTLPYISIDEKELVTKILDPSLVLDDDLLEEVWAMAIVARSCLNPKPSKRPLMRYILKALENPLKVVRQDPSSTSGRLKATSSRGSWNAALFGSWRQSSSDITTTSMPGPSREALSSKLSGNSQGSNGERSFSRRKPSKEIFPEPSGGGDLDTDG